MKDNKAYKWNYISLGGIVRAKITTGEDIAHLGDLEQEKWTVLSCPVDGLEFDPVTLGMIDTDADGKIRVDEMVAAAQWITKVVRNRDLILKGDDVLPLKEIDTDVAEGKALFESAKHILASLGKPGKEEITVEDTSDSVAIFKDTKFNGDGVITPITTDDEELKAVITNVMEKVGSVTDRCGEQGVNAELVEKFFAECVDYSAWQAAAEADKANVFPYGDNTPAALDAVNIIKDKIADYFMRCKLVGFDSDVAAALDVSVEKIGAISDKNLSVCADEIAAYPLARPSKDAVLPFDAINPAWKGAFACLKALVLDAEFAGKDSMTEDEWNAVVAKFGPYNAWMADKKGSAVESLGLEYVNRILADSCKYNVMELISKDEALRAESESIDEVNKLTHLYRDFARLLDNYVVFMDFYGRNGEPKAAFEAGKLYIDERCCNLCLKVHGTGDHAEAAALSGMFLIYCTCTSKKLGKTQNIVAVMTDGSTKRLRPGKNGIFYDRDGNDWDAVVTKIVDNPISVKQAFLRPYIKFANTISERINKSATDKESKSIASMTDSANAVNVPTGEADKNAAAAALPKSNFDIAKFAGIFAAIGMAVAYLTTALAKIVTPWTNILIVLGVLIVCISGPSMFLAWQKLRKRNLGPVLNANGWAINSIVLVNVLFGKTLTNTAKYPMVKKGDPYRKVVPLWKKLISGVVLAAIVAFAIMYFTDNLGFMGIHRKKAAEPAQTEQVAQAPEEAAETAPAAE